MAGRDVNRLTHGQSPCARGLLCAYGEVLVEDTGEQDRLGGRHDEAARRSNYPDHTFFFDLGDGGVIDRAAGGNSSRWINH